MSFRAEYHGAMKGAMAALFGSQVVRFGIVSVIGMVVDVAIGWFLSAGAGMPLTLAATTGFVVAAALNYMLHARWTFADATNGLSAWRGGLYLLTLGTTLATRLGVVAVLQAVVPDGPFKPLLALVPAIGASFVVNFLLNKLLVFRGAATHRAAEPSPAEASH